MARAQSTDPLFLRPPAWLKLSTLAMVGVGGWFALEVFTRLQTGEPFSSKAALVALMTPLFAGLFLYLVGAVIEIDERQVVSRWCGWTWKEFETRSLQRVDIVVNAWMLRFEGGGTLQLNRYFDGAAEAAGFLTVLLEARDERNDEEEEEDARPRRRAATREKPTRRAKPKPTSKARAVRGTVNLPLLHLTFPDACVACGNEVAHYVPLDVEHRTFMQRLSGTYTEATVNVPSCSSCYAPYQYGRYLQIVAWVGAIGQLVASVKWETHNVLVAVGVAFPLFWFAASDLFVRLLSRRALRLAVVGLDPARNEVKLRFVDPRRASEVVALTEETRVANLEAAGELLESGVG